MDEDEGDADPNPGGWTPSNERWSSLWSKQMKLNQQLHDRSSQWYITFYTWMKIPIVILAAYSTISVIPEAMPGAGAGTVANSAILWSSVVTGILMSIFLGIVGFVDPSAKSEKHRNTSTAFTLLSKEIDIQLLILPLQRQPFADFMRGVTDKFTDLMHNAPPLPSKYRETVDVPSYSAMRALLDQPINEAFQRAEQDVEAQHQEPQGAPMSEGDRALMRRLAEQMDRLNAFVD